MKTSSASFSVAAVLDFINNKTLDRAPEFQRGEVWRTAQKAAFVDSLLRGYPVPGLIFADDPSENSDSEWVVVDGRQRLRALHDYVLGAFALPEATQLRAPQSVRTASADWLGRRYDQLAAADQERLLGYELAVTVMSGASWDEVRDAFIRHQGGTPLAPQQVRDAFPGDVAELVRRVGGWRMATPEYDMVRLCQSGGAGSSDETSGADPYVRNREFCARLLAAFFSRRTQPDVFPRLNATAIDNLYHTHVVIEDADADAFCSTLAKAREAVLRCYDPRRQIVRVNVACTFLFAVDHPDTPVERMAARLAEIDARRLSTKGLSLQNAARLENYYRNFARQMRARR
ncbi:MAG: DUF262 domain-containing protein [Myxococcales bacterium]|nr:DUF262 domain-containing protein [Myxococcales bacterium]MCB9531145.1 DUF262 domain-containing protein [Myxococcales bacterium]